ncbi:MAG TPA: DUF2071 domain-containing protein [Vicinamibacterales bacterium]
MHPALTRLDHRPWPLPATPWRWRQVWHDLLFIHWPVPAAAVRPLVPEPLAVDERGGSAWLSLVPFHMSGVTLRGLPAVPWLSAFAEMNLRTYVTLDDKPGVWFLRMDAARALAVWTARLGLGLPYVWSSMRVEADGPRVRYRSERGPAVFEARYGPTAAPVEPAHGSLEAFLTERYCLYTVLGSRVARMEIHHPPWPLQAADATVTFNSIPASLNLPGPIGQPLMQFSRRQDVVGWGPTLPRLPKS